MSFNGVTPYDNFLPSASQSDILLNALYLRIPDYDGELILIRNGVNSYALLYNLELSSADRYLFDYIQYANRGGAGSHYEFEFGQGNFLSSLLNNSYIYQSTSLTYGGNAILASGFTEHMNIVRTEHFSFVSSILLAAVFLFSCLVNFFKKVLF